MIERWRANDRSIRSSPAPPSQQQHHTPTCCHSIHTTSLSRSLAHPIIHQMSTHHRNHSSPNITLHFDGGTGGPNLELDGLMIYAPNDDTSTPPISCTGPALKYRDLRESRDAMRAQLSASPTPHEDISHDASRFLYNKVVLTQVPGTSIVSALDLALDLTLTRTQGIPWYLPRRSRCASS